LEKEVLEKEKVAQAQAAHDAFKKREREKARRRRR
jgi:hypothetical protein